MAERVRDWRAVLVISYSDLFHPTAGDPPSARGWPHVDDGWRDLLERACVRIRAAVQAHSGSFRATQVKERHGTLRFCWEGDLSAEAAAKVEEALDLAEARSAVTCEASGEFGRLHGGRRVTTCCTQHAEGRRPVQTEPDDHIYVFEQVVGQRRNVQHRRYDRESDSFVEVDVSDNAEK